MLSMPSTMAVRAPLALPLHTTASSRRQRLAVVGRAAPHTSSTSKPVAVPAKREGLSLVPPPVKSAATSFAASFAAFVAALPARAVEADPVFSEDFYVSFLGQSVDHKVIIYLIVLGQFVGFIGATVSGLDARKRKAQVEELNMRLLKVNAELRRQARDGQQGMYGNPKTLQVEKEGLSEEDLSRREKVITLLKAGKAHLKEKASAMAETEFTQALAAIESAGNALEHPWKATRKAYRGLGSAAMQLGQNQKALNHMLKVVEICREHEDEPSVVGDALGIIADIYTDMGDMEQAAEYYDKYLQSMNYD